MRPYLAEREDEAGLTDELDPDALQGRGDAIAPRQRLEN